MYCEEHASLSPRLGMGFAGSQSPSQRERDQGWGAMERNNSGGRSKPPTSRAMKRRTRYIDLAQGGGVDSSSAANGGGGSPQRRAGLGIRV